MLKDTLIDHLSGVISGLRVPAQRRGGVLRAVAVVSFQDCVLEGGGVAVDP
jgi:hypothetical protein